MSASATAPQVTEQVAAAPSGPRKIDSAEVEPLDLGNVAGAAVTKRLVPIGIGALVLFILWRLIRK